MDNLKMQSPNLVEGNVDRIAALFPNCIIESRDENGVLKQAVDFDLLRQELSDSLVEGPQERYTLNWPGKNEAILTANAPIAKTLRPCEEESADFANTKNIFIEGDNLDVLKLLQETYLGKIKMIYIDPPYNTGNDFIYEDDFADDCESYKLRTNQKDEVGNRLVANTEANGRFHSDWLSMIYPRLKLSRNLLRDDGVIFISIDDNEVVNLRRVCDEIFGEKNFIATVLWQKVYSPKNSAKYFSTDHDYLVAYARNAEVWRPRLLPRSEAANDRYENIDNDPRGPWKPSDLTARNYYSKGLYEVTSPSGKKFTSGVGRYWRQSFEGFKELGEDGRIWWGPNGDAMPAQKRFLSEVQQGMVPQTMWFYKDVGHTQEAKKELLKYVSFNYNENVLNSVKPTRLIERILQIGTTPDAGDIILDFFAGSAPTAHAIIKQNEADKGNRRYILVQLPEPLPKPEQHMRSIFEMGLTRVRNVGLEFRSKHENILTLTHQWSDLGFRVFKLDTSNMKDVYYTPDQLKQESLDFLKDHIKTDRRHEDLLFQVFIDLGLELSLPISKETIDGKTIFIVDTDALIACFDTGISEELVKKLAKYKPLRVVFRDDAFGSDSVKINVEQIFKLLSPGTEVKTI